MRNYCSTTKQVNVEILNFDLSEKTYFKNKGF